MKRPNRQLLAAILTAAAIHTSCDSDDPARVGRPPVVTSYYPGSRVVTGYVGDTLSFRISAFDPDDDALTTTYEVDGTTVARSSRWDLVLTDTGQSVVRGTVSDGENRSYIEWQVTREEPVNYPPVIEAVQPQEVNPTMVIGTRLDFAVLASDPEGDSLSYTFTIDDSLVTKERQFSYLADLLGGKEVRVVVTDGARFAARDWHLKVTVAPDTIAPALVPLTYSAPGTDPGEVDLEWVAVGRDGMIGIPSVYEVRTAPVPILTEEDWLRASDRPDVPEPVLPGVTMRMTVRGLLPARETYVAVRAFDDFGNLSPIPPPVRVTTRGMRFGGTVRDPMTGEGVAGARVHLGSLTTLADATGAYEFAELPPMDATIAARDEDDAAVGAYFDYEKSHHVVHQEVVDLYLLPVYPLETTMYSDFLSFFRSMTDIPGNPYGPEERRWQLPVNLYVRPYVHQGLDYRETIQRVAGEFDAILGTSVFNLVSAPVPEGVETVYRDGLARDYYNVVEWTSDWYPRLALIEFRTVYTPASVVVLEVTARHELGHALGLGHSLDTLHLMVGGPAPNVDYFSADEVAVIRCFHGLPRGWNNRGFVRK
jgi:hypothetical protein